jgi:hypothetical protein
LNRNNFANNNNNNRNANNQQAPLRRSNSVNARLGSNGPAQNRRRRLASNTRNQNTQLNKPMSGRIVKRNPRKQIGTGPRQIGTGPRKQNGIARARNIVRNGNALGVNPRRGRIVKRWILVS